MTQIQVNDETILTSEENKAVQRAIRGSLDLYRRYVAIPYVESDFQRRETKRLNKEIPLLASGLRKLRKQQ